MKEKLDISKRMDRLEDNIEKLFIDDRIDKISDYLQINLEYLNPNETFSKYIIEELVENWIWEAYPFFKDKLQKDLDFNDCGYDEDRIDELENRIADLENKLKEVKA